MSTEVLVVDDNEETLLAVSAMLTSLGYRCQAFSDARMALRRLRAQRCELVLADIRMPHMDGLTLLREIRRVDHGVDVIMMTGFDMDYTYVDVIEAGATDFILKPVGIDELEAKLKRIERERALKDELYRRSIHDVLTGVFNRSHLFDRLGTEVERARRQDHPLSLIILDIDNFKAFNDSRGHLEGDRVLAALGEILQSSIRKHVDAAFRYGGDEFAILLIEAGTKPALRVAERIRSLFEALDVEGCTLSLGLAQLRQDESGASLVRRADEAMYEAKRAGGNRVRALRLESTG